MKKIIMDGIVYYCAFLVILHNPKITQQQQQQKQRNEKGETCTDFRKVVFN